MEEKKLFRGEAALGAAVVINSLGVVLMLYSGAGISAISSVPYAFSEVLPALTLGKAFECPPPFRAGFQA